ncbi:MAG TPA: hypothetical protein ENN67_01940 [Firmicutes bacterium]|nr:hypothetical protein [Bacillota bacterium]
MAARIPTVIISLLLVLGCSNRGIESQILAPDITTVQQNTIADFHAANRFIWGAWDIVIEADRESVEIIPVRTADIHLNVVKLLETPPCYGCLTITNIHIVGPNVLEADVTLKHPFPGLAKYTGFDVRGIFIAQSDFTFPVSGRKTAVGDNVPKLINADGYTSLFNPTDFPPDSPGFPALKYIPGKFSTGGDLSATLNPFIAYRKEMPRRMFPSGGSETRTFRIYAPPGPIHFGYAVDANWVPVENVTDPLVDFPPEANCMEAYKLDVKIDESNSSWGSSAPISVEVFDAQGIETISSVIVEVPALFDGVEILNFDYQTGPDSFIFAGEIPNADAALFGDYPALVKVIDFATDPNLGAVDAWYVANAHVKQGWARSWGGTGFWNRANSVAIDQSGNILVAGSIDGPTDMDPGPGEDIHFPENAYDASLSKFSPEGEFIWARTWGGSEYEEVYDVAVDTLGNAYVLGFFRGTVDFDPGPGEEIYTSLGSGFNLFISKFNSNGDFVWVRTWLTTGWLYSTSVAVSDTGGVFVAGQFSGSVDFNPGPGEDILTAGIGYDAVLFKLDTDGNYHWVRSWGSPAAGKDGATTVAVNSAGYAYVTGFFSKTADFDPGPSEDIRIAEGSSDAFLCFYSPDGNYLGAWTWGGMESSTEGHSVAVSGLDIYVAGTFRGIVDMDPGSGEDIHESFPTWNDVFLSKFNAAAGFQWAKSWGGPGNDTVEVVSVNSSGIFIIGGFSDTVDFDPGPGEEIRTADDTRHMFLTAFTPGGNFLWVNTWDSGSTAVNDGATGLAASHDGFVYMSGNFRGTVDFDPTDGTDNHTAGSVYKAFLMKLLPDGSW